MDELLFSKKYYVRKLQKNDIDQIYDYFLLGTL